VTDLLAICDRRVRFDVAGDVFGSEAQEAPNPDVSQGSGPVEFPHHAGTAFEVVGDALCVHQVESGRPVRHGQLLFVSY
jgi:hypothetical protein